MRLTQKELRAIKKYFIEFFEEGDIYLFGSRVDDTKRGGDIDLYISTPNQDDLIEKKIKFASRLTREIEYKRVDIVLDYGKDRLIDRVARAEGIRL